MTQHCRKFVFATMQVGQFGRLILHLLFKSTAFRHIPSGSDDSLQLSIAVMESCRVVGHDGFLTIPGACGEFVVRDLAF